MSHNENGVCKSGLLLGYHLETSSRMQIVQRVGSYLRVTHISFVAFSSVYPENIEKLKIKRKKKTKMESYKKSTINIFNQN